jgi:FAD/FMN-containing dehydrogenase
MVTIFFFHWPWDQMPEVIGAWETWAPAADPRVMSILKLPVASSGKVFCVGQFIGPLDQLASVTAGLTSAVPPAFQKVEFVSYIDAVKIFGGVKPDFEDWSAHWDPKARTNFKNTSHYSFEPLTAEAVATIQRFLSHPPTADTYLLQWDSYGGAVSAIPPEATAFPHRAGTIASWQYQAYWTNPADAGVSMAWVNDFRAAMSAYLPNAAYRNYDDLQIQNWGEAYYGQNFSRLRAIKTKYDPGNVFQFPQSIPPLDDC